jgi:hypothetical protein
MPEYVLITEYGSHGDYEDTGFEFFADKRALNKHVKEILSNVSHWNQYNRYICKVIGFVDYSKAENYSKVKNER